MSYLEHRKNFSTTANKRPQRQDNVKDLWSMVSILDREHYGLQQRLLRTGATIVWKNDSRPIRSTDEDEGVPLLSEIDTLQSQVATIFAILRHFPNRFRSYMKTPDRPEEYVWGFSHEDWFRANACLQRHLLRRQKHKNITVKDTQGDIKDWPGFIQPAAGPNNDEEDDDDNKPPDANVIVLWRQSIPC
ncbi:hypothetical protein NXS19_005209 [Fusarium pseudograminearum]|nr:hypothetical protein NXS19_005209 [Fusarium pseudograminearum]